MVNVQIVLENQPNKIPRDFEIQTDHLILTKRPELALVNKKKRICHLLNFAVLADLKLKIKGSKKVDKCLDLVREQKTKQNKKTTNK